MRQIIIILFFQILILLVLFFFQRKGVNFFSVFCFLLMPFPFFIGAYFNSFNENICYSNVIYNLNSSSKIAILSTKREVQDEYIKRLEDMPIHGYESQCHSLEEFAAGLHSFLKSHTFEPSD